MAKDRVDRDDEDLVRLYLTDIGQYTLLTKDDEVRLAKAIEADNEAIAELDAGEQLTAAKKRELRRTARKGEEATIYHPLRPATTCAPEPVQHAFNTGAKIICN